MSTIKQRKALSLLEKTGGSVSAAMRAAGYAPGTAKNPKQLTSSKAFKEFWDNIPDELLIKVQMEGLNAKQFRYSPEGELVQMDDFAKRHKYIDSAMKGKRYYAPEKHVQVNIDVETTERERALADELLLRQRS